MPCNNCVARIELEEAAARRQQDYLVHAPITPEVEVRLRRLLNF
jgi:hypothetical protein